MSPLQNIAAAPPISVVIPCYNARAYIGATLRSVMAQQLPDLEIIVVDDGSTDGSAEFVARDFPLVRVERQSNQGVAAARNRGIELARGDWIAFVDADDIWLPGKLQAQWRLLQDHPDVRCCYSAWKVWRSEKPEPSAAELAEIEKANEAADHWQGASGWIYDQLLLDCWVWTSTVLVERKLLTELGGFDPTLRLGEDYDLWLRISRHTPILRVPKALALYRDHPHSITKRPPDINYQALVVTRALERWGYRAAQGPDADPKAVARAMARCWNYFAAAHLQSRNTQQTIQAGREALRWQLSDWTAWKLLLKAMLRATLP
jgi:glycosyltransferase involved in cell wall biosynthesis